METCQNGDAYVAIATVIAVIITGIISFLITKWQVKKQGKDTIQQLNTQYQNALRQMQAETPVLLKRKKI
jgi:predicted PurR-regulated permease PerM